MTAKSVIQVDIDPEGKFKAFYDLYKEYEAKIEGSAESWDKANESIDGAADSLEKIVELSDRHVEAEKLAAFQASVIVKEIKQASKANTDLLVSVSKGSKAQKEFSDEAARGARSFSKMAKDSKKVADSVFGIGKHLLKLGAIAGGIAGLGGLLSGLGLRELASSAVETQGNARALGINPGQYTAFNQDFGRYIDPSVLGSVANAQNSFNGRTWLARALGINQAEAGSQGPDQLAAQLALKAHDWWVNTPESMRTAENLQTTGLPQSGFSLEMVRQQGNTPRAELERAYSQYQQDQKRFNVNDKDTDAWYGFLRQIKDAGNTIETSLKNKLVALAPDLQKFVDVIGKDAEKLITEVFTPKNLQSLADGIGAVSGYLGSEKFRQDMKDFADLVGDVVGALRKIHNFFNPAPATKQSAEQQVPNVPVGLDPDEVRRETRGNVQNFGGISTADKALGYTRHFLNMPPNPGAYLADLEQKNGLPTGALSAQWQKESTRGKNLVGPVLRNGDQAIGDFQFTAGTWKEWGKGGDRFSFKDEANAAANYMAFLKKKYKGDVSAALAAYNWGPGNVDKAMSKPGNWQDRLPRETRDYLNKIVGAIAKQQPAKVQVTVTNNTAARVAVQANAAAAQ